MQQASSLIIVYCTVPDDDTAESLAHGLLETGLAACVSAIPRVVSRYRWAGRMERSQEVQLLIKTTESAWDELASWLSSHHPYDNPEIIATPLSHATDSYAEWIREGCAGTGQA